MNLRLYALDAVDVDQVGNVLESALGIVLRSRDSSYWGDFRNGRLAGGELRVYANRDPLYQPETDPPEDEFFESEFRDRGVLVSVARADPIFERVHAALQAVGVGAMLVRDG